MRQRITLFHEPEDSIDPQTIKLTTESFEVAGLKTAREDRVTISLEELPVELRLVLKQSHELHIRYINEQPYDTASPLVSRLSPGLHVLYSPQRNNNNDKDLLCPLLHKIFAPISKQLCETPEVIFKPPEPAWNIDLSHTLQKSFTKLPTQRFQHSTALQYYLPHSHLTQHTLFDYILSICPPSNKPCLSRVELLRSASYLDIDYDTISHALALTAYWPPATYSTLHLTTPSAENSRLEVGLLSSEPPTEPEELSLGGFLTSLGDGEDKDNKPSPTLFSFPSRHHPHTARFSTAFLNPTGLHPTLKLSVTDARPPAKTDGNCALHAHLTLPRVIFADKNQLDGDLFMRSHNLSAIRYITTPVDLEAPEYAVDTWGSSLLLELAPPQPLSKSKALNLPFTATIPLHLRYLQPSPSGYRNASIPVPVLFWACTAEEGSKFAINPFDRVNLGYEGLFGPRTMFYHLSPDGKGYIPVEVPVLKVGDAGGGWAANGIEFGTAAVIAVGFLWVLWVLGRVLGREGYGKLKLESSQKKKQ